MGNLIDWQAAYPPEVAQNSRGRVFAAPLIKAPAAVRDNAKATADGWMTRAAPLTVARRGSTEMREPLSTANTPTSHHHHQHSPFITRPLPPSQCLAASTRIFSLSLFLPRNRDTLDMKRFSFTHSLLCAICYAALAVDDRMLQQIDQHATAPDRLCSAAPVVRSSRAYHSRRLRREASSSIVDRHNAIYLNGTVGLRLRTTATERNSVGETDGLLSKLRQSFTVQVWVKIEGGQVDPATIICESDA